MKNRSSLNFRELLSFALLISFLISAISVAGQTQKVTKPKTTSTKVVGKTQNPYDPSSGWSGVITYTKTLDDTFSSDEPVFGRLDKQRNRVKHQQTRTYKYEGKLFLDGSGSQLLTKTQVSFRDEDKQKGSQVIVDSCHAFNDEHEFIDESRDDKITKGFAEGPAKYFNIHVGFLNDTSYNFSFQFPKATATYNHEYHVTHKGYCQPKNNLPYDKSDTLPTTVEGESVKGEGKIDPNNPDVLTGSRTWGGEKINGIATFKYTVSWSLRRNPGELEIENIAFDEHPYPDWESWKENTEGEIVDSNIVRIRAKIVNYSSETKFPKIEFKETKENITLPDSEINISIAPGEQREVQYIWDTSGFAWGANTTQMSDRQIKVELTEKQKREKTKDVLIIPKPVVLAHGLWADYTSWDGYDKFLYKAHSMSWHSYPVGKDSSNGVMNTGEKGSLKQTYTIQQNSAELGKQIEFVQKNLNAWHLDIVAHSMGGLISRYYIYNTMKYVPDGKPTIQHLVMLGTPNMGSPCANLIHRTIAPFGTTVNALAQLDKGYVARFNKTILHGRGTRLSNLIGTIVPQTCISPTNGDGVVEWTSAVWTLTDVRFVSEIHTKLTDEPYFRSFVLKRLAISRLGDHSPDKSYKKLEGSGNYQNENGVQFVNAGWNRNESVKDDEEPQDFVINAGKQISLSAKQSSEIEIPVSSAGNSGVTIVAPSNVSATLIDEKGVVVGKSAANSAEAKADFRSIPISKPMNAAWKLKLENTGTTEAGVIVSAWTNTNPNQVSFIVIAGKPTASGQVPLQAKITENGSPVKNVKVTAMLSETTNEIAFFDDGLHNDGTANDGIYGATTEKLTNEDYVVQAKAEVKGQTMLAVTSFTLGAIKSVAKTKSK